MDKRILVIDDDEGVAWVIRKTLEPFGHEVVVKTTIKAGLKALDKFSLILLDLVLPDGNGIEALQEIRVFNPNALVIIVTAHGRMESAVDAMEQGAYVITLRSPSTSTNSRSSLKRPLGTSP